MKVAILTLLTFFVLSLQAQNSNVGINTTNPDTSAVLDLTSSSQGVLVPRVNLVDVSNAVAPIASPSTGLLVWNTNGAIIGGSGIGFYYFNGTQWTALVTPSTLDTMYDEGGPGAGRILTADAGSVKIIGTDGLLITGTLGSGDTIDAEVTGVGTRMFFNPKKAAFRAGGVTSNMWDDSEIGNYSLCTGLDNVSKSGRTFTANYNNQATTNGVNAGALGNSNRSLSNASYAFGWQTISSGNNSISTGKLTEARGYDSFTNGEGGVAQTQSEVALGTYPKGYTKTNSSGTPFIDSDSQFYTTDRLFVVGNGTSTLSKHNAFEIWKDQRIILNEAYSLPSSTGSSQQVLTTNGTGTGSWTSVSKPIAQLSMFADNSGFLFNQTVNNDIGNIMTGFTAANFASSGNVEVKVIIRYTNRVGTSQSIRLFDHANTPIIIPADFTNTATGTGGVFESAWKPLSSLATIGLKLYGRNTVGGDSMTIKNVQLLVRPQ